MNGVLKESIAAHYDEYSTKYDQKNKAAHQDIIDGLAFQEIKSRAYGKDVLEVGCGTGIWMEEMKPLVKSIAGVDLSSGMVEQARRKGLKVKKGDAELLPFSDASFDLIYSYRVLPHVPDLPRALAEMKRVLRNDGKAILMFYNKKSIKYISRKKKMEEKVFTSFYSVTEVMALDKYIKFAGGYKILPYPRKLAKIPGINWLYSQAEKLCSKTFLKRYGGNILFELGK